MLDVAEDIDSMTAFEGGFHGHRSGYSQGLAQSRRGLGRSVDEVFRDLEQEA